MKKHILLASLLVGLAYIVPAQSEGFIGYTASYGRVRTASVPTDLEGSFVPFRERKAFTNGITLGYVYYFKRAKDAKPSKFGLGTDLNVQFRDGDAVTATWVAGIMYKPTAGKSVQPFVRVMAGAGRLGFKHDFNASTAPVSTARFAPAYVAGVGIDIAKKESRLKWRIGADYVLITPDGRNEQFVRATTGLVF